MRAATRPTPSSRRRNSASSLGGQKLAALLFFVNDAHALGTKTAQGLTFTESFYWDLNDATRAFSKRFAAKASKGQMPSMTQVGVYSGVLQYLKVLEAMGGNPHDGAKVVAKMKEMPWNDPLFGGNTPLRADGRRPVPAHYPEEAFRNRRANGISTTRSPTFPPRTPRASAVGKRVPARQEVSLRS